MKKDTLKYLWRIASSHMTAYFIAGLFAVVFMNYKQHYASASLSLLMRPLDSPWVAIGPLLQIVRGMIIGLALFPFRKIFLEEKNGALKLMLVIFGISFFSTIGPTPGSFEGYIYTVLPVQYHLLGIPEATIYTVLFSVFVVFWYRHEKKYFTVLSIIMTVLIALMSILGVMQAMGILEV